MMLKRMMVLVAAVAAGTCLADQNPQMNQVGLAPRKMLPKRPTAQLAVPSQPSGRLVVKFTDSVRARFQNGALASLSNTNLAPAEQVVRGLGLEFQPAIKLTQNQTRAIEVRAENLSGRAQPDLAGMMYVTAPQGASFDDVLKAARLLNDMPEVEFVDIEPVYTTLGGTGSCCVPGMNAGVPVTNCVNNVSADICEQQGGFYNGDGTTCAGLPGGVCDMMGACCLEDDCQAMTEAQCTLLFGDYGGDGTNCVFDEGVCDDPDCGSASTGDCFLPHDGSGPGQDPGVFCNDQLCCTIVCQIFPFCCDVDDPNANWDENCAFIAQSVCQAGDPCESGLSGSCFEVHGTAGCNVTSCCNSVCGVEPFCCDVQWDDLCVDLAEEICPVFGGGATPNFADGQGYLDFGGYLAELGAIPPEIIGSIQIDPVTGEPYPNWGGEGFDLAGMEAFSQLLLDNGFGEGTEDLSRGKTIRVGVIEHSAFVDWHDPNDPNLNHEELVGKINPEPGQTIIIAGGNLDGNHGTACLGIVGAKDQGDPGPADEHGTVGMAPDAKLYFFPIVSAEEGGRLINAFINAVNVFEPGDVLSFSIGPGGCNPNGCTLAGTGANWTLMRLASDLGITCCIAAGNSCCNVDDCAQAGDEDSGVVIVGACFPGAPFCRLGFSNHCRDCGNLPNVVHCSAWGTAVLTTGYGDLFFGDGDRNRSYAAGFGGTSAACPMVASLVARIQGIAKQFYGISLMPEQIRTILGSPGSNFFNQCQVPNPANLPGSPDDFCNIGDFDPEEDPRRIGNIVDAANSAISVVSGSYFGSGSTLIDDVLVIRGDLMYGNKFSIRAADNNFLVVKSKYTKRNHHPPFEGPAGEVTYLATAQMADIMVTAHSDLPGADVMIIDTVIDGPPIFSMFVVETYNWTTQQWDFVGFEFLPGGPAALTNTVGGATAYVNGDTQVLIREYIMGFGTLGGAFGGGGSGDFLMRWDLVNLSLFPSFGGPTADPGIGLGQ